MRNFEIACIETKVPYDFFDEKGNKVFFHCKTPNQHLSSAPYYETLYATVKMVELNRPRLQVVDILCMYESKGSAVTNLISSLIV